MIVTILLFVVLLGLLVFVHEFGHFITAKRAGATVLEFGFGFPPRIAGIRRKGTVYSINWIPLGGFVKIKGESGDAEGEPGSFSTLAGWRRALILIAGVGMNIVLAIVLFAIVFTAGAPTALDTKLSSSAVVSSRHVQILDVAPSSSASQAGLKLGDYILAIDGNPMTTVETVQAYNATKEGIAETITIERSRKQQTLTITPQKSSETGTIIWGVSLAETGTVRYPWYVAIWYAVKTAFSMFWQICVALVDVVKTLIVHQRVSADIAGPIGIAALTGQVASLGAIYFLQFAALLSLNLAVINILPFPALDGGRVFFLVIEKVRRKKMNARVEAMIHNVGFGILLLLIGLVTIRDISRFGGALWKTVTHIFGG